MLLTVLGANLILYNVYSASILAQTQGPTEPLDSPLALLHSGMAFGAENLPWVRFWFEVRPPRPPSLPPVSQLHHELDTFYPLRQSEKAGVVKTLYEEKLKNSPEAFLKAVDGIARVRKGGFAFQVILSKTSAETIGH